MSASDTPSPLSANSRDLKRFRLMQKLKSASFLVVIGMPLLLGVAAYGLYENLINPKPKDEAMAAVDFSEPTTSPDGATMMVNPDGSVSTSNGTMSGSSPSGAAQTPATPAPTQTGGMPEGVNVALNSIEQNGIKGNHYVSMDTSNVPDGTAVRADRGTWTAYGNELGSVRGTISAYGQTAKGSLTFQFVSGTWKVTGYSIDS